MPFLILSQVSGLHPILNRWFCICNRVTVLKEAPPRCPSFRLPKAWWAPEAPKRRAPKQGWAHRERGPPRTGQEPKPWVWEPGVKGCGHRGPKGRSARDALAQAGWVGNPGLTPVTRLPVGPQVGRPDGGPGKGPLSQPGQPRRTGDLDSRCLSLAS